MGLEDTTLGELSQTQKYKYCMISLLHGLKKKIKLNVTGSGVVVTGVEGLKKQEDVIQRIKNSWLEDE